MSDLRDCKTCKFLEVDADVDGIVRVRKHVVYNCTAPVPELPNLPVSVTRAYGFPKWPPAKTMVGVGYGIGCPAYEKRVRT